MTGRERMIQCAARHLPAPIARSPEQVLINLACVLIGIGSIATERPGSLLSLWPAGFDVAWATGIATGGVFALVGLWGQQRQLWASSLERLGYLLILIASVVYGVGVITVFGWQGAAPGVLFLTIAAAKAVRLLITSAARIVVIRSGDEGEP